MIQMKQLEMRNLSTSKSPSPRHRPLISTPSVKRYYVNAKSTTALKMTTLQFIDRGVTSRVSGKKLNDQTMARNRIETVSTNGANRPILQRAGGRGCFFQRLIRTQEIEMMYEDSSAAFPSDIIALNAMEEPMLMSEKRKTMTRLTQSAFSGTVNLLLTYSLLVGLSHGT